MNALKVMCLFCFPILFITFGGAGFEPYANETLPQFNVDAILNSPHHAPFGMLVGIKVMEAFDMPQYYAVNVLAFLGTSSGTNKLQYVMKVAKEGESWDPGYECETVSASTNLESESDSSGIFRKPNYSAGVFLRPGSYKIAVIAYDSVLSKASVVSKNIKLPRLKGSSPQQLNDNLPGILFSHGDGPMHNLVWPLRDTDLLPVKNPRPLCIDVVVIGSLERYPERGAYLSTDSPDTIIQPLPNYFPHATRLPRYSSYFSHLKPGRGDIRVSILDLSRTKMVADRANALGFDWRPAIKTVLEQNSDAIDAASLGAQINAPSYFVDQLNKILKNDECVPGKESPLRIIIVVSRKIPFAKHALIPKVDPKNYASTHLFYVVDSEFASNHYNDDLHKMLRRSNATSYIVTDRVSFLTILKNLISKIETLK
jgi:hypothetical protein